jgi:PAS domain S-box-containing protein
MSDVPASNWPFEDRQLQDLVTQLNHAEAALQTYVGGQSDVIIDPLSGVPVLLREAQQALFKSEVHHRRLANILQTVQDGVIVTDLEGRVTYWNDGARAIYGYTEDEMLGQSVALLYDDAALLNLFLHNARNGIEYHQEWEARRKDGSSIWIHTHMTAMRDSEGELVGALRISQDIAERKRAEEALRTSEAKYRALFEVLPVGVSVLNRARQILEHNSALVQILDTTEEQFRDKDFNRWHYIRPDGSPLGQEAFASTQALVKQKSVLNIEMGILKPESETTIWITVSATPVPLDEESVVVVTSDISEQKRAQDALQASEKRFRALIENSSDAITLLSAEGRVVYDSPAAPGLLGYTPDELVGQSLFDLAHPDDLPFIRTIFVPLAQTPGQRASTQFRVRHKSGAWRWVEGVATNLLNEPSVGAIVVNYRDITDRKMADDALRESEERFRLYFDLGLVGMAISSPTRSFMTVNRQFEMMMGYDSVELVNMNWAEITHPDDLAGDLANFKRVVAGEINGYTMDKRYIRKNGQVIYASLSVTCRRLVDGSVDYLMALVQDITDRKEAEAALKTKNEELQVMTQQLWQTAKLATLGELAASIAHELNNPLATIQLRVESLLTDAEAEQDASDRRALEIVGQEADRMARLVANLLQFSRRSVQQISTTDVCEEIQNTLELIQYHFQHRHIRIMNECADDLPLVPLDRQQLRQLFLNLFTNASDAMPEGGTLKVRASYADDQIVVEVSDTGQGITPENMAKVMEPFFTTKPEGKGTGLGLPICRRIVQEHGGTFELESDGIDGHGTTARIKLPLKQVVVNLEEDL